MLNSKLDSDLDEPGVRHSFSLSAPSPRASISLEIRQSVFFYLLSKHDREELNLISLLQPEISPQELEEPAAKTQASVSQNVPADTSPFSQNANHQHQHRSVLNLETSAEVDQLSSESSGITGEMSGINKGI